MSYIPDIDDILKGRTVEEIVVAKRDTGELEHYQIGGEIFHSRDAFLRHVSTAIYPKAGVFRKEYILPEKPEDMTDEEFDSMVRTKVRSIQTNPEIGYGTLIIMDPVLVDIVASKNFGMNYDKKNPSITVPYDFDAYTFAVQCKLKHRGQTTFSDPFLYRFFMIGNTALELTNHVQMGEPFVLIHGQEFKGGQNRDTFEIGVLETVDIEI